MKKTIAFLTVVMAYSISFAHGLTEGSYTGNGLWKSNTAKGNYQASTDIGKKTIQAKYVLAGGTTLEWNFDILESANGFFDVISHGKKLGSGYCLDNVPVCHYEIATGKFKLEETLVQQSNTIYRYGSKDEGRGSITWQESLDME